MPFTVSVRTAVLPAAALAALAIPAAPAQAAAASVTATVETAPVSHSGDAADDPAIWVHPTDPARSVVVATDKKGALEVYDLSGTRIQRINGDHGNNVDLRGDIVVSADDDFTVYDRTTRAYLGRFSVAGGAAADDCEDTDGIDATAANLGPAFPQGVFICQDGSNGAPGTSGNQNFKLVPLQRITALFR
ncbi:phytase [Streptomyces sp. IBSNAI002]|uniref:phytase n=1 Tax=Streptomyces sp. IBSNAI002 TaxID=3457500 RepID=UPI003FD64C49